jgi:hypothetical protein
MTVAVLKTLVHTPEGDVPSVLTLAQPDLPIDVVLPKKGLVFFYGGTEASREIASRMKSFRDAGHSTSVVEVSVEVGDARSEVVHLPRDPKSTLLRLNRLSQEFREELTDYLASKLARGERIVDAASWVPPRFLTKRLDLLEQAARTKLLKPVDVLTFHVGAKPAPLHVAMLLSSKSVTKVRVVGPHHRSEILLPKGL